MIPEAELRARLGAPADARQVMVVTESTHWDPNWLITSNEYFRLCVRRTLDRAIDALVADPRRVFSLECAFFPDLYWERRPARQELFRTLVNEGRLRFTGSGVTTPDTLLPEDELLLRDLLVGQEWLRTRGMTQEPRVLYLPDSFGHSPGVPSLLAAAGVPYAAVCRIDGMRFPGADMEPASNFPRPGTSAERLLEAGTADFVWRGPDGSEVLTHWMTYSYGHGDMIASGGLSRALGLPTSWPDRRERSVATRIEGYIEQLSGLARTPYLLLAIGFDFVQPVPDLVGLLDRWNRTGYDDTGVWLVNAGLDDYFDLVAHHRDDLPTLELDPNPYWMGFYASRPDIKSACRNLARQLVDADNERARIVATGSAPVGSTRPIDGAGRARAWWTAVTSNHHDYVTGTAPDRVAKGEQMRWLQAALTASAPSTRHPDTADSPANGHTCAPGVSWTREGPRVTVVTSTLTAVFDETRGGALVSLRDTSGTELLRAPSLEFCSYAESGGLWRMGHEFRGGRWARCDCSTDHPATITVADRHDGDVVLSIRTLLEDRAADLTVEFRAGETGILVHTSVTAPLRRTVTLATHQHAPIASLAMHQPGGMVVRDLVRWYQPTFWPLHSFASALATGDAADLSVTVATATPTAVHVTAGGTVETVVARTAVKELAFGVMPVLAPAWGRRWGTQVACVAMEWAGVDAMAAVISVGRHLQSRADRAVGRTVPAWLVDTDDPLVEVITVKVADRGAGIIVRLRNWADAERPQPVRLSIAPGVAAVIRHAIRADSRERDLTPLVVVDGVAQLDIDTYLTTVRLELTATAID